MLKCENIQPQLSAYLDREMPAWKAQLIQWHLKRCPDCAHEAMRLQQTDTILRQLDGVKTADRFLSDVMRQASTMAVHEKHRLPWMHRVLRRLESSFALAYYHFRTQTRPYALVTVLALVMTLASVVTLYPPHPMRFSSEAAPMLAQAPKNKQTVLFEIEIISLDELPKPHISPDRQSPDPINP